MKNPQPATPLSRTLLLQTANNRHGLTLEPQRALTSLSDIPGIIHVGVPGSVDSPWQSAAGGVGRTEEPARLAAIGEAVERYCATIINIPIRSKVSVPLPQRCDPEQWHLFTKQQRAQTDFPFDAIYSDDCLYTNVFDFQDNSEVWIPHPFVVLRDEFHTGVPTSSGLAAGPSANQALLRAIEELIERDALMTTWMHSVPARSIAIPDEYCDKVANLHGEMWAFDLTPAYSPFPVIAVAGGIKKNGVWRYTLGVACREHWEDALEKAYLEWNQGVLFAGIYGNYVDTSEKLDPRTIKSFDEHAIYYTLNPQQWHDLPMFKNHSELHPVSVKGKRTTTLQALKTVKAALRKNDIRMYYRDLTTIDAHQLGIRVIRAASPDLVPIFAHQEWPLIGGGKDILKSRYPWAPRGLVFPNVMPHPLG